MQCFPLKVIYEEKVITAEVVYIFLFPFIAIGPKIDMFDDNEVEWVIAHEIGHILDPNFKINRHLDMNTPLKIFTHILCVYLAILFSCRLICSNVIWTIISMLITTGIVLTICLKISWRWKQKEYDADLFATQHTSKAIGSE